MRTVRDRPVVAIWLSPDRFSAFRQQPRRFQRKILGGTGSREAIALVVSHDGAKDQLGATVPGSSALRAGGTVTAAILLLGLFIGLEP